MDIVGRRPAPTLLKIFRYLPPKIILELISRLNLLQSLEFEELLETGEMGLESSTVNRIQKVLASKWVSHENRKTSTQLFWSHRYESLMELLSPNALLTHTEESLKCIFHLAFLPLFVSSWEDINLLLFQPGAILAEPEPVIARWGDNRPVLNKDRIINFARVVVRGVQSVRLLPKMLDAPGLCNVARHFDFYQLEFHFLHLARAPLKAIADLMAARRRHATPDDAKELAVTRLGFLFCKINDGLGGLLRELEFGCRHPNRHPNKRRRIDQETVDQSRLQLQIVSTQLSAVSYFELVNYVHGLPLTVVSISSLRINGDTISRLFNSLRGANSLLDLTYEHQKLDASAAESLGKLLGSENCRLERLVVRSVEFEAGALFHFSAGLATNTALRHIDLSHADPSNTQESELLHLFSSLGNHPAAETIVLDDSELPLSLIPTCIASLAASPTLTTLGFRGQYLTESVASIAHLLRARHLLELDIDFQGARFGDFSSAFFLALSEGRGVDRLHLTSSRLNDGSLAPLVALLRNGCAPFPVQYLDLSFNHITELGATQLKEALALGHHPQLSINLFNNSVLESFFTPSHQFLSKAPVSHRLFGAIRSPEGFDDYYS